MAASKQPAARASRQPFTLRQLETFVTVAMTGSVSAAAERVSRTQSAVSLAIQDLESALNTSLFERRGRRLVRTEAAQTLLPRAIEMVDRAREISALVSEDPGASAVLTIGASRTVGPFVMPEVIKRSQPALGNTRVELRVANSEELIQQLNQFALDCAFIEGSVNDPGLHKQPWLDDHLCLFARQGHPMFRSRTSLTSRLAQGQWVLREEGSGTREIFLNAVAQFVPTPAIAIEVDDPETQMRLVRDSNLLSCISRRAIAGDPRGSGLREITGLPAAMQRALVRRFWIVRHPDRYRTRMMDALLAGAKQMRASR